MRSVIRTGVLSLIFSINSITCKITPFIIGPIYSNIRDFPHSASINSNNCYSSSKRGDISSWLCGAAIVTDRILITAGHCVERCDAPDAEVEVFYGDSNRKHCTVIKARGFITHQDYTEKTLYADLSLILIRTPLKLNINAKRAAILREKDIPYHETGYVAGWGNIDALAETKGYVVLDHSLKHINQTILSFSDCLKILKFIPAGVICGKSTIPDAYPSIGDSGSALIVNEFILVGLVSFKISGVSNTHIVYTDIGYHYSWITEHILVLSCIV